LAAFAVITEDPTNWCRRGTSTAMSC